MVILGVVYPKRKTPPSHGRDWLRHILLLTQGASLRPTRILPYWGLDTTLARVGCRVLSSEFPFGNDHNAQTAD